MAAKVDAGLCTGCKSCIPACQVDAISMRGSVAFVDDAVCVSCGACIDECPREAISME